jgi:hypothetical protein
MSVNDQAIAPMAQASRPDEIFINDRLNTNQPLIGRMTPEPHHHRA